MKYLLYIFLFLLASCNTNEENNQQLKKRNSPKINSNNTITSRDSSTVISLSAIELTKRYVENEIKADIDFLGKTINVKGEIEDIKKGISGEIFIVLKGGERYRSVLCYYENEAEVAKLKKGETVVFEGKCTGLLVNVVIENCKLIKEQR